MSIKCKALSVSLKGRSSICVQECGSVFLKTGDVLLVDDRMAKSLYTMYKPYLSSPFDVVINGQDKLKHGHYEVHAAGLQLAVQKVNQKPKQNVFQEFIDEIGSTDKSMNSETARKVVRRKRRRNTGDLYAE